MKGHQDHAVACGPYQVEGAWARADPTPRPFQSGRATVWVNKT